MPKLAGLLAQGFDEMRMGMAERTDRDTAAKIEISFAARIDQPRSLPVVEGDWRARISVEKRRLLGHLAAPHSVQKKKAARCGGAMFL